MFWGGLRLLQSCDALSERKRYGRASKEKRRLCRPPRQWCRFSLCPFADFRYCVARAKKIGEPPIIPKFFCVSFLWLIEPPVARQKKSIGFMRIFATHLSHIFDPWWHHFCLWLGKPRRWLGKPLKWLVEPQTLHTCPIFFPHCTDLRNRGICRPESECCILI